MPQKALSDLNACSKDDFVAALSNIFEYSPWIAEQAASVRPSIAPPPNCALP
jgi:2-oxo-4-hydroxy-4-carboxy-5-ureidoimidazoline decarboxylase